MAHRRLGQGNCKWLAGVAQFQRIGRPSRYLADRANRPPFFEVIVLKNFGRGLFAIIITAAVVLSTYAAIRWLIVRRLPQQGGVLEIRSAAIPVAERGVIGARKARRGIAISIVPMI
jgi:hypothetical protein